LVHSVRFVASGGLGIGYNRATVGCIGKQVALQELRVTIGSMVMTFDAKFAPGFDMEDFNNHTYDRFVAEFDRPLQVIFTKRPGVNHGIADHAF
jgi:hypothetical protein